MEEKSSTPAKETKEVKAPVPGEKKKGISCWAILGGCLLGLLLVIALAVAGIVAAISATGLVEVPVFSEVFKPAPITEDFSYTPVSEKQLEKKLGSLEETKGKLNFTLTDDEVNSIIAGMTTGSDSFLQDILVKFSDGVIKIRGTATVPGMEAAQDSPIYLEIKIAKSANQFEFEIQEARLGALPFPSFLLEGVVGQLLGTDKFLGKPDADSLPVEGIAVRDGSITITGLDLSKIFPPEE